MPKPASQHPPAPPDVFVTGCTCKKLGIWCPGGKFKGEALEGDCPGADHTSYRCKAVGQSPVLVKCGNSMVCQAKPDGSGDYGCN